MKLFILACILGVVVCNPRCRKDSECASSYCHGSNYVYCENQDSCQCRDYCKKDSDCEDDNTNELSGRPCLGRNNRYCDSRGICRCHTDDHATDNSCSNGNTGGCHNIICPASTSHLACVNDVCTCQSYATSGGCMSSSDCHSVANLATCPRADHHCVDKTCMCVNVPAQIIGCTGMSDCSGLTCTNGTSHHCLDGVCKCV